MYARLPILAAPFVEIPALNGYVGPADEIVDVHGYKGIGTHVATDCVTDREVVVQVQRKGWVRVTDQGTTTWVTRHDCADCGWTNNFRGCQDGSKEMAEIDHARRECPARSL